MRILAADIGGTKTVLQLAEVESGAVRPGHRQLVASQRFPDVAALLEAFLAGAAAGAIDAACLAVAGPVTGGRAQVTNLGWQVDAGELAARFRIGRVSLLNDFAAVGYGIETLGPDELAVLQAGTAEALAPRGVIGAGTGLGMGLVVWTGDRHLVLASEGGHVDFAPVDNEQVQLLRFLWRRQERVSCERLLSGAGLVQIFEFACERAGAQPVPALAEAVAPGAPAEAL
ncbi:MAG: glucokinase, partial [Thermodesulfobacteriota bacterium]